MLAGIKQQLFINRSVEFFSRNHILSANKLILMNSGLPDPFRKSVKNEENALDIVNFLAKLAKEKRRLPTFVIFEPHDVKQRQVHA
jgi:hypothetical protein